MRKIWKLHKKMILSMTVIAGVGIVTVAGAWVFSSEEEKSPVAGTRQTTLETTIKKSDQVLENEYLVYNSDGYMGLMNERGEIVLDAGTERIKTIESLPGSNWFECLRGDYTGFYFNTENERRIKTEDFSIDEASFLNSEYSTYYNRKTEQYGIVDKDGQIIIEPAQLDEVKSLISKNAHFMTASFNDESEGVLNTQGELLAEPFDEVILTDTFNKELDVIIAHINKNGFGVFHSEKGLILSPEEVRKERITYIAPYDNAPAALYSTEEGLDGIIDREGAIVRDDEGEKLLFNYISNFSTNGYASARTLNDESVIIDEKGEIVASAAKLSEKAIHDIYGFNKDGKAVAVFSADGKEVYGVIDEKLTITSTRKNKEFSTPEYLGFDLLSIRRKYNDESPALITSKGKELLSQEEAAEEEITEIGAFTSNGLSVVVNEEYDEGLLDKKGRILFPIEEGATISINQVKNIVEVERLNENSGKSEIIYTNVDGALLYSTDEDSQLLIGEQRIMLVHSNGETEVFDDKGRMIATVKVKG